MASNPFAFLRGACRGHGQRSLVDVEFGHPSATVWGRAPSEFRHVCLPGTQPRF
ncbi:MAG: hypothetical protein JJE28_00770 [Actinomycetales bacterium]|nr:hypothetical protein [Actinomycetales bacterium]